VSRRSTAELVDLGDLDELLRRIDDLCDDRDWDGLADLRQRCRAAFARGRQLWPAASHAEYRLALQAPGPWAASVVEPGAGQFALGPLSEVAASTHTWEELASHLPASPEAALVAYERVLRGEDLTGAAGVEPALVELPLRLEPWEPDYPLATYKPYTAEFGDVATPPFETVAVGDGTAAVVVDDPETTTALVELVSPWTTQSNGHVTAVAVEGDVTDVVAAVAGVGGSGIANVRLAPVDLGHALAVMAWTAASGGAHGRRRGLAYGRFAAWWATAALAGELDAWPRLDAARQRLRWYRWERPEPPTGWALRLAAERPATAFGPRRPATAFGPRRPATAFGPRRPGDGRAWAVEATDRR
jgi:hypothetical protein